MSRTISADATALLKLLLHGAKHPSRSVNGLLLGRVEGDKVVVVDAIPLFHTFTCLASPLEIALRMVDVQLRSDDSNSVVGYYEGGAMYGRPELSSAGSSIATKLAQIYDTMSVCLLIDNVSLADMIREEEILPLQVMVQKSGSWQLAKTGEDSLVCEGGSLRRIFLDLLHAGKHHEIIDFDEHLDDPNRDYMNEGIKA